MVLRWQEVRMWFSLLHCSSSDSPAEHNNFGQFFQIEILQYFQYVKKFPTSASWSGICSRSLVQLLPWYKRYKFCVTWMGSIPITWLEWFLFPFIFVGSNILSRLGYKSLEGVLPVANLVILDRGLCVLKSIVSLNKRGVCASALIKKHRYWTKYIVGGGIQAFMNKKQVEYQERLPGEVYSVGFDLFSMK